MRYVCSQFWHLGYHVGASPAEQACGGIALCSEEITCAPLFRTHTPTHSSPNFGSTATCAWGISTSIYDSTLPMESESWHLRTAAWCGSKLSCPG